jgi:hypothetical protein
MPGTLSHNGSAEGTNLRRKGSSFTAKNQYRKLETKIRSPHSCVCEQFIYSHDRSAYYAAANMWTDPGIAHRHINVEMGLEAA